MTLEELDQEDQTLREVVFDLKKLIGTYELWIRKNAEARAAILADMEQESSGVCAELVTSLQGEEGC